MAANPVGDWRELCKKASQEHDPEKLLNLIRQINLALSMRLQSAKAPATVAQV